MVKVLERLRTWARALKRQVFTIALAITDPRTPWPARVLGGLVVAYAFSPVDLIPDFIPVLGLLDDLILVPAGIALCIKLIPAQVLEDHRQRADELMRSGKPVNRAAAVVIVLIWLVFTVWLLNRFWPI
jgi:uncharacterized membrane protein YkvA (DUF1232 family)